MVALVLAKKSKSAKGNDKKESKEKKETSEKPSKASVMVDKALLGKAVKALLKHHETQASEKNESQLLGTDTSIQVQFTMEVAPVRPSRKPYRIDIPHSIFKVSKEEENEELEEPEVCIFVKDGSKEQVKEMIDQFPEHMGFIKKVMTLDSLRKKHSQYSQRRALLKTYSVFMADDRILPMLTKCLGKDFSRAKKNPIPVEITRKEALPVNILKALSATFLHLSEGTCAMVKAGYTHMSADQLVENILAIVDRAAMQIPRRWANIRALAIKTPTSMSLPFYNKTPADLAEIARLAGVEQVWQEKAAKEQGDEVMEETGVSPKKRKVTKSPLVQALKKQKKMDSETKEGESKSAAEASTPATKKNKKDKKATVKPETLSKKQTKYTNDKMDEDAIETPAKTAKKDAAEKSSKKKQRSAAKEPAGVNEDDEKHEAKETSESKPKEAKQEKADKVSKDTPKRKDEEKLSNKKNKRKSSKGDDDDDDEKESPKKSKGGDFVASKKFTGSKKGYVFRKGPLGLGYYVDIKPVPDKAALAALARMADQGRRKSSGSMGKTKGGKKSKGRRSF